MSDGPIRQRASLAMGKGLQGPAPKKPNPGFARGGRVGRSVAGKIAPGFKATRKMKSEC